MYLRLPPDYVLHELTLFELSALLEYKHFANLESWEQARFQGLCTLQPNTKQALKPTDILKFDWEQTKKPEIPTDEELQQVEQWFKNLNYHEAK